VKKTGFTTESKAKQRTKHNVFFTKDTPFKSFFLNYIIENMKKQETKNEKMSHGQISAFSTHGDCFFVQI